MYSGYYYCVLQGSSGIDSLKAESLFPKEKGRKKECDHIEKKPAVLIADDSMVVQNSHV